MNIKTRVSIILEGGYVMKKIFCLKTILALALAFGMFIGTALAFEEPWRFGVIADTQWTKPDDGKDPNTCAADIIKQVDQQFIAKDVKFVIAVGDTVDVGSKVNIDTRALFAQDLYNAGIGFYPLRGNHEAAEDPNYLDSGLEFQYAFPQIGTGLNNNTPGAISTAIIPAADLPLNSPGPNTGPQFKVGDNFSFPTAVNTANNSISYSFDYKNARFVLLDQFDVTGNYYYSTIPDQQPWINAQLSDPKRPQQAFVFIHKNLLGGNHKDNMFGGPANNNDPGDGYGLPTNTPIPTGKGSVLTVGDKQNVEDAFIHSLAANNVRFCISGHDHHHYHSIVSSPITPSISVHQLITQSDSSKFYTPVPPFSGNDLPLTQDLYRVGYYILTVDGPRVTVDYYASDYTYPSAFTTTPNFAFVKRDSFGYGLNGKEFLVCEQSQEVSQGNCNSSYTQVVDSFRGTTARILSGTNSSTATTNTGRNLTKSVDTGWARGYSDVLASNILTLWGMADLGSGQTDVYTLSMTYEGEKIPLHFGKCDFGIATKDDRGNWVNAVDMNYGGVKKFVVGPWNPTYELGTYGVDPSTHTAWAVINYNSQFAVTRFGNN
jgi:hypothetical protein